MSQPFERLIRFEAADGEVYFGDLGAEVPTREIEGREVEVLGGSVGEGFVSVGRRERVVKLLCPLPSTPIIMCVGLNYKKHAAEGSLPIPTYPAIFTKPPTALSGPLSPIPVHPSCTPQLDYEAELTIVIGRPGKNIPAASAHTHILGLTAGNDVSARNFQLPASVSGGQFGYAKSFDGFAPVGPCVASLAAVGGDAGALRVEARVNGEVRQGESTGDMIWSVGEVVEHLSRGTTLLAGTCIMTGTPSGVGVFMEPKGFLQHGDEVEVYVQGIGSLINKIEFEDSAEAEADKQ